MMRRLSRGGYRRRGASGVAFAYFTLLGLPVLVFGAGMSTDFTRIIVAERQVSNATQAAALAGAQQFAPDSATLNTTAAVQKATETYCYAQAAGEMSLSRATGDAVTCPGTIGGQASIEVTPVAGSYLDGEPQYTEVDVTSRFEVTGLVFARLFGSGSVFAADPITRSATVCLPGETGGATGGYCAHPSAD